MPFDLSKNPHILTPTAFGNILVGRNIRIHGMRFVGGTAGDTCTVAHLDKGTLVEFVAVGTNFTKESRMKVWAHGGYEVAVIGSGILYIYLEEGP
jgi:hypothetical protein